MKTTLINVMLKMYIGSCVYRVGKVLILLLLLVDFAYSANVDISGTIFDNTGAVLPNVHIANISDGVSTVSNADGAFRIPANQHEESLITFYHIGFKRDTLLIRANSVSKTPLTIVLHPINIRFSPVTVIGNHVLQAQQRYESSMHIISGKELKLAAGFLGSDVFRVLGRSASSSSTSEFSNQLYIRGGTPDQNLTLLNGIPIYQPYHLLGLASSVSEETVDYLKFYTGNFSTEYGEHMSSVVDIVTKSGSSTFGVETDVNLLSATLTASAPITPTIRWRGTGRRSYYDILSTFTNQDFGYNFQDFEGKLSYMPTESSLFTLSTFLSQDDYVSLYSENLVNSTYRYDPNPAVVSADSNLYHKKIESNVNWGNRLAGLNFLQRISDEITLNVVVYYSDLVQELSYLKAYIPHAQASVSTIKEALAENERRLLDDEKTSVYGDLQDTGVKTKINLKRDTYSASFGAGISRQKINFNWQFRNFDIISPYINFLMDFPPDTLQETFIVDIKYGFIELNKQVGARLLTRMGFRYSFNGFNDATALDPRLNVRFILSTKLSIKGAWGVFSQHLGTATEYGFYSLASAYFPIEDGFSTATHSLFGLTYQGETIRAEVNVYDKVFNNILFQDPTSVFVYGEGRSHGVEFSGDILLNQHITTQMAYTYSDNEKKLTGETFHPNYDIRHNLKMSTSYKMNDNYFGLSWTFNTGRPANLYYTKAETAIPSTVDINDAWVSTMPIMMITPKNFLRYPMFHRLDFRYARGINFKSMTGEIYLNIINLYGRKNVLYYDEIEYKDKDVTVIIEGNEYVRTERSYSAKPKYGLPLLPIIGVKFAF